ncbi:transcriptional regulator ATRX-like [Limulus polyphemus]|uniref:Transcriptional regulator ATRX-like n=1 Tax=Limulus polyphemus TaxID=6850 RepID=A0ABM1THE6_LIMPO|nr:transcriptional regulator ATRX-like [Limulus polyphemus]
MSQPMIDSEEMVYLGPEKRCQPRSKISVEDIAVMKVTCTACGNQINHYNASEIKCHIHLRVLMCKKCFKYYGAGIFQKDETGVDEYCRWCGDGGNLILCDFCENAFCKECINRNFGPSELSKATVAASWQCYVCNSEPLSGLVSFCSMVKEYAQQQKDDVKDKSEKKSDFQSKNIFKKIELIFTRLLNEQTLITGSESWLEDNFAQGLLSLTMTMEDLLKVRKKYERKASEPTAVDDGVRRIQDVLKIHIHNVEMVLNNIQASYLAHKNHLAHQSEILSGKSFLFLTENIASDSKSEMDLQNEGFDKTKNIKDKTAVFKEGLTDQLNPQCGSGDSGLTDQLNPQCGSGDSGLTDQLNPQCGSGDSFLTDQLNPQCGSGDSGLTDQLNPQCGSGDSFKEPLCEDNYEVSIENEAKCKNIEKLLDTCYENVQLIKKPQVLAEDIATGINESLSDNLHYSELDNKNGEEGDEATHELHLQCENPESVRKPVNKEGEESSSTTEINRALLDLQYENTELVGESIKKERETRSTDVETTSINNEVAPTQELQCENQKLVSEPVTKKREENSAESENSKINKEFSETLELFDEDIEEPLVKCEEKKLPEILKSQCKTAESFAEQPSEVGQKYPTKGEATKHVLHTPELQGEIVESKVEQQNTNHTEELKEIESIDNNKILVEMHEVGYENVKSTKEQGKKDRDNMIRAEGIKIKDISDKSTFFSKSTALVMESPNEGGKEDFEDVKSGVSSGTEQSSVKMYIKCNEEKEMKNKKAQCVKTKITLHGRSLETSEEKTESEVSQHKIGIDELNKESTDNEKTRDLLLKDLNVKPSSDDFDFADVKSHQCNVFTDGIKTCRGDHNSNSNDDFTDHDTVNNKINDNQEIISHYTDNSSVKDDNTDNLSIKESLCGYNKLSSNPQVILQRLPENIVDVPCMEKVCKAFIQKRGRHSSESSLDELEKDVGNLSILSSLQKENKKQKCSDGKVVSDKDAEETNVGE